MNILKGSSHAFLKFISIVFANLDVTRDITWVGGAFVPVFRLDFLLKVVAFLARHVCCKVIEMESRCSDTDSEEQQEPLLHRGRKDNIQPGKRTVGGRAGGESSKLWACRRLVATDWRLPVKQCYCASITLLHYFFICVLMLLHLAT